MTDTLVLAVGDAGCAVCRQFNSNTAGVIVAINTSRDSLERSGFERQLLLGPEVCGGKRAVSLTQAEKAVVESKAALKVLIQGVGRIVVVADLGGSTGSVALALEHGAQVSVAVTLSFTFEQTRRLREKPAGQGKHHERCYPLSSLHLVIVSGHPQHSVNEVQLLFGRLIVA